MKKLLVFTTVLFHGLSTSNGQSLETSSVDAPFHFSISGEMGNLLSGDPWTKGFTATAEKQKFTLSFSYSDAEFEKALNLPKDYRPGFFIFSLYPGEYIQTFSLRFGRVIRTTIPRLSFQLDAGPSLVNTQKPVFEKYTYEGWFSSNYSTTYEKDKHIGLSTNALARFRAASFLALEAGANYNANPLRSYISFQLGLAVGLFETKKEKSERLRKKNG